MYEVERLNLQRNRGQRDIAQNGRQKEQVNKFIPVSGDMRHLPTISFFLLTFFFYLIILYPPPSLIIVFDDLVILVIPSYSFYSTLCPLFRFSMRSLFLTNVSILCSFFHYYYISEFRVQ